MDALPGLTLNTKPKAAIYPVQLHLLRVVPVLIALAA